MACASSPPGDSEGCTQVTQRHLGARGAKDGPEDGDAPGTGGDAGGGSGGVDAAEGEHRCVVAGERGEAEGRSGVGFRGRREDRRPRGVVDAVVGAEAAAVAGEARMARDAEAGAWRQLQPGHARGGPVGQVAAVEVEGAHEGWSSMHKDAAAGRAGDVADGAAACGESVVVEMLRPHHHGDGVGVGDHHGVEGAGQGRDATATRAPGGRVVGDEQQTGRRHLLIVPVVGRHVDLAGLAHQEVVAAGHAARCEPLTLSGRR